MKLKKFAALALAGVMAVSMLAGCAGKPADSETTTTETTSIAGEVVSALSKKDEFSKTNKITVSESASLKTDLDKATKMVGVAVDNGVIGTNLSQINTTLKIAPLPYVYQAANQTLNTTSAVANATGVVSVVDNGDFSEAYIVNELVNDILTAGVWYSSNMGAVSTLATAMPTKSGEYTTVSGGVAGNSYMYTFAYSMDIAVSEVENELTGTTTYVAAFVLTRTPTQTAYEA